MNYAALAATASRLIASNGKAVTLRCPVVGSYDPVTGIETGGSHTDYVAAAVESPAPVLQSERADVLIQAGDRFFTLGALGLPAPTTADRLIVGAADLAIISVRPLSPGDMDLYYEVQARG